MRYRLAALLVATTAVLTACGAGAGGAVVKGVDVSLPDGRTVTCVSQDGGGVNCDWETAR